MIEIKNLNKKFNETIAINNLNLTLDKGIIGLVGHNGAGKSTLFRLIMDIYSKDSGEILIDTIDNTLKDAKKNIFFLNDNPYVRYLDKAKDIYNFYSLFYKLDKEKYYSLLNRFNLPLNKKISLFSKGMKRALFLALTLAIDVKYYLLDEAFDGLDPLILSIVKEELITLSKKDKVIIISSHNILNLEQLVDKFILLYKGRLSKKGNLETLSSDFIKYQIIFNEEINLNKLNDLNLNILNIKKIGSIHHIVFMDNKKNDIKDILKSNFKISLIESIPIDSQEIISLEMLIVNKEENKDEYNKK